MKIVSPSQLDGNNPGTWPIYYKIVTWIAIVAAIAFLAYKFLITPVEEQIIANERKISEKQQTYQKLYQYTLDLAAYQQRSAELVDLLRSQLAYLPTKSQMPELINSVYKVASDNGINIGGFTPVTKIIVTDYYDVAPIALSTETHFENFSKLAEQLAQLERIMNISDFSMDIITKKDKKDENNLEEGSIEIKAQLQTYIYNQDIEALSRGELPVENADKK